MRAASSKSPASSRRSAAVCLLADVGFMWLYLDGVYERTYAPLLRCRSAFVGFCLDDIFLSQSNRLQAGHALGWVSIRGIHTWPHRPHVNSSLLPSVTLGTRQSRRKHRGHAAGLSQRGTQRYPQRAHSSSGRDALFITRDAVVVTIHLLVMPSLSPDLQRGNCLGMGRSLRAALSG